MIETDATFTAVIFCTLMLLLAAAVVTDIKGHRIPNILLAPALSLALLSNTLHAGGHGLVLASGGLVVGLLMFLPLYIVGGMAAGDVKLLGVVGSFLGPLGAVLAGFVAMMAGAVFGLFAIAWRRLRPRFEIHASGLPNSASSVLSSADALSDDRGQDRSRQIAYAPAIAAGAVAALWYLGYVPEKILG